MLTPAFCKHPWLPVITAVDAVGTVGPVDGKTRLRGLTIMWTRNAGTCTRVDMQVTERNDGFESYSMCADDRLYVGLSVRGEGRRPQMHLGFWLV